MESVILLLPNALSCCSLRFPPRLRVSAVNERLLVFGAAIAGYLNQLAMLATNGAHPARYARYIRVLRELPFSARPRGPFTSAFASSGPKHNRPAR